MTDMTQTPHRHTQIQTDLPRLTDERIEQMLRLACTYSQQPADAPFYRAWVQKWFSPQANLSRRIAYGFGTLAVTTACLAFIVFSPATAPTLSNLQDNGVITDDTEISDMMLYDLLEDLT